VLLEELDGPPDPDAEWLGSRKYSAAVENSMKVPSTPSLQRRFSRSFAGD
jgi:hypothetical protein